MKKGWFVVLAAVMALCVAGAVVLPLAARGSMTLSLSGAAARAGEQTTLTLSLSGNPGVAALYVRLVYDPAVLTLDAVRDNALLEDFAYHDANGEAVLSWEPATYDNDADGVLAYLDFTLAPDAPDEGTTVSLYHYENGIVNRNTEVLNCLLESAFLSVLPRDVLYSDTLSINPETMQIGQLLPGTTIGQVKAELGGGVVITRGGAPQAEDAPAATGMSVISGSLTYTLLVTGDADGDGLCDERDLDVVKRHLLAQGSPEGVFYFAADVSGDGRVTITDFLWIKAYLAGTTALLPRQA